MFTLGKKGGPPRGKEYIQQTGESKLGNWKKGELLKSRGRGKGVSVGGGGGCYFRKERVDRKGRKFIEISKNKKGGKMKGGGNKLGMAKFPFIALKN